jgi:hypothetical protein
VSDARYFSSFEAGLVVDGRLVPAESAIVAFLPFLRLNGCAGLQCSPTPKQGGACWQLHASARRAAAHARARPTHASRPCPPRHRVLDVEARFLARVEAYLARRDGGFHFTRIARSELNGPLFRCEGRGLGWGRGRGDGATGAAGRGSWGRGHGRGPPLCFCFCEGGAPQRRAVQHGISCGGVSSSPWPPNPRPATHSAALSPHLRASPRRALYALNRDKRFKAERARDDVCLSGPAEGAIKVFDLAGNLLPTVWTGRPRGPAFITRGFSRYCAAPATKLCNGGDFALLHALARPTIMIALNIPCYTAIKTGLDTYGDFGAGTKGTGNAPATEYEVSFLAGVVAALGALAAPGIAGATPLEAAQAAQAAQEAALDQLKKVFEGGSGLKREGAAIVVRAVYNELVKARPRPGCPLFEVLEAAPGKLARLVGLVGARGDRKPNSNDPW